MLHINACALKSYFDHEDYSGKAVGPWDEYYKFSTVRNPWKKMVSYYFFYRPDKNFRQYYRNDIEYDHTTQFHFSFNEWLKRVVDGAGLPSYEYFCCDHSDPSKCLLDDVFKIEDISETLPEALLEKAGIEIDEVPKLDPNYKKDEDPTSMYSSWKGDYYSLYNSESIEIVKQIYQSDITKFNYAFGE
tara:strand:+ start:6785 stop:7348 length:564 start_codon:yes stop_codon:yes gene_type:complete